MFTRIKREIKHFIYHSTDTYYIYTNNCIGLNYSEYVLYRYDKFLLFKIRVVVDTASSLNKKKMTNWYYQYSKIINF